jgi:hypothetical protein
MRTFLVVAMAVVALAAQSTPISRVEQGLRGPIAQGRTDRWQAPHVPGTDRSRPVDHTVMQVSGAGFVAIRQ